MNTRLASTLLLVVLVAGACSSSEDPPVAPVVAPDPDEVEQVAEEPVEAESDPQPEPVEAEPDPEPEPVDDPDPEPEDEPDEAPPAEEAAPLATAGGDLPGLTLEVMALRRSAGDAVTLEFAIRNDGDQDFSASYALGYGQQNVADFSTVGGTYVLDVAEGKKYLVLRDSDGACVCSSGVSIPAGERGLLFATFPAPSVGGQSLTVVVPHFVPIDDVPIEG